MSSYNKINYNLRSAKSIERKLIFEVIREIVPLEQLKQFRYIGFGSIFYTDFRIVHKELGIDSLVCIESQSDDEPRFIFNKPYKCIELRMGSSTIVLPQIDWDKYLGDIVWLDYDGSLMPYMFEDLNILASKLKNGSFLIITCNGTLPAYKGNDDLPDLDKFKRDFEAFIPAGMVAQDLNSAKASKSFRRMFLACINQVLEALNGPIAEIEHQSEFIQLFNLCYKDGAKMFTFGGLISKKSESDKVRRSSVFLSGAVQSLDSQIEINAPILTHKEIDLMNKHLPCAEDEFLECAEISFVPEESRKSFLKYYRQFPNFMEVRDF